MINDNSRNPLIVYRVEQARETVELAKFLIESDKLAVAVNRIYYGIILCRNSPGCQKWF